VRIEEMLIVHKDSVEIVSNFPVEQITWLTHAGLLGLRQAPGRVSLTFFQMTSVAGERGIPAVLGVLFGLKTTW
jgi:hypothetical protein